MIFKAIIFDLDGVLVDTAVYHYKAWRRLTETLGFDISEEQNEQLKGVSRMDSLKILLSIGNVTLSENDQLLCAQKKNKWYVEYINTIDVSEILPGVLQFLKELKLHKYTILLGSASKNAQIILERTGLLEYFDEIVDGNSISKAKPDPQVFITGADRCNIAYDECVVFEDSIAGITAANSAGMFSIGVGDTKQLSHANYVIPGFQNFTIADLNKLVNTIGTVDERVY